MDRTAKESCYDCERPLKLVTHMFMRDSDGNDTNDHSKMRQLLPIGSCCAKNHPGYVVTLPYVVKPRYDDSGKTCHICGALLRLYSTGRYHG